MVGAPRWLGDEATILLSTDWNLPMLVALVLMATSVTTPQVEPPPQQVPGSDLTGIGVWVAQQEAARKAAEHEAWLHPRVTWHADWNGIAECETGSNWHMVGPRFSGGVGFYNGTWTGFGGRQYAANAGYATKEQQIAIAERVYARHGLSGWGCRAYG